MYAPVSKSLAVLGIAATLGACAAIPDQQVATRDRLSEIHAGLAQDQVRAIAGKPPNASGTSGAGETLWIYPFTDDWGYASEFDVEFDAQGVVLDTSAERLDY